MVAGTMANYKYGLIKGHAYTVLGVAEYNGHRLIKCRNPWATERYTGPWSDEDSDKWTDDAKKALGHNLNMNDGIFFIPLSTFRDTFYNVIVNLYDDNWKISQDNVKWDRFEKANNMVWKVTNPV